jgi:preprotein translocase subunit SecF
MKLLRTVPANTNIQFINKRYVAMTLSLCLVLSSVMLYSFKGLNLGIDFLGGIMVEARTKGPADIADLRSRVNKLGLGEVSLQRFGKPDVVLIRLQRQPGGDQVQEAAVSKLKKAIDSAVAEYRRTDVVGPTVGTELKEAAFLAVVAAIAAILVYIWFRFEWQFGVGAIVALAHDVVSTVGLFSLFSLEFNLSTVAALLTIAGYSINDTVVVFDRVRENMRKYKKMPLPELFNRSINETLSRTVNTSLTTMLALLALVTFGGEVIRGFTIAMMWGIFIGTYSSIALAVPLLLYLNVLRGGEEETSRQEKEAAST